MPLKAFSSHAVTQDAAERMKEIRHAYSDLAEKIQSLAPHSRERSVALTELETSAMWAIKAITHNDPESKQQTD